MLVTNADQARVVSVAPAALYDANSAFISSISLSGAADAIVTITPSTDGGQSVHSAVGHCAVRPPGRRWRSTIRAGEMTDLIAQMEKP